MKKIKQGPEVPGQSSKVENNCIKTDASIQSASLDTIYYQHTVLCQTCMPYRNPGDDVREWKRKQGDVSLSIEAGEAMDLKTGQWKKVGLPYGPKARLIISHLNSEAIRTGTPEIDVERSLTAFIRRIQDPTKRGKLGPNGREISMFKEQLMRLSVATIRLGMANAEHAVQVNSQFVETLDFWLTKSENNKPTWTQTLCLSQRYFKSLQKHAVPLSERALAALSHSAMALDIYAWLAQRLHRIPAGKPQFIAWAAVKEQFGSEYGRMCDFRRQFHVAFSQVLVCYPEARIESNRNGLTLKHSYPPISARIAAV